MRRISRWRPVCCSCYVRALRSRSDSRCRQRRLDDRCRQARAEDRPPHLRPVRRASRPRHLWRRLGRAGLPDPQHARHPQRRGRRAQGASRCRTCAGPAAASPTNTTGATASGRATAPATLNPNWGGVIEPNTFGTHEFMDFVAADRRRGLSLRQRGLGHAAGSRRLARIHDHRRSPRALAKERAANGHPEPYDVAFLGIGNEIWGCGGSMTPDYYVEPAQDLRAASSRNYNPRSSNDAAHRRRARRRATPSYTEAVMKAWKSTTWSWDIEGLSLHHYTVGKWPPSLQGHGLWRKGICRRCSRRRCAWTSASRTHCAIMDKYDPEKKIALVVDEWGVWLAPTPGTNRGFPGAAEQPARRHHRGAEPQHLRAPCRPRAHGQHRADGQRAAGHDPHRQGEDAADADLSRASSMYVPFQDATFLPVTFNAGSYSTATSRCRGSMPSPRGQGRQALAGADQPRSESARYSRACRCGRRASRGRNAVRAQDRQRQHFRGAGNGGADKPVTAKSARGKLMLDLAPQSVTVVALER